MPFFSGDVCYFLLKTLLGLRIKLPFLALIPARLQKHPGFSALKVSRQILFFGLFRYPEVFKYLDQVLAKNSESQLVAKDIFESEDT